MLIPLKDACAANMYYIKWLFRIMKIARAISPSSAANMHYKYIYSYLFLNMFLIFMNGEYLSPKEELSHLVVQQVRTCIHHNCVTLQHLHFFPQHGDVRVPK